MKMLKELENTSRYDREIIDIYFNDNFVKENLDKEQALTIDYVIAALFEKING